MRLSHSLPIIEDAVYRFGLSNEEIAYLLESEVEKCHLNRGQIVHARVSLDGLMPGIQVYQLPPLGGMDDERPVIAPLQPTPQAFLETVENYRRVRIGEFGWDLALARCIAVENGFSVIELIEHAAMSGEIAVLPHSRLGVHDRQCWAKGQSAYVAFARALSDHRDGVEAWHALKPRWVATRADSVFLRKLVKQFFGIEPAMAELYGGIGMVVLDERADLGAFVGTDGENVKALETLCGAKQIVVVRKPGPFPDRWRLKRSIQQLTAVKRFAVVAPKNGDLAWKIIVHRDEMKLLLGIGGCRLMFISRLSGLIIETVERTQV